MVLIPKNDRGAASATSATVGGEEEADVDDIGCTKVDPLTHEIDLCTKAAAQSSAYATPTAKLRRPEYGQL